MIWWIKMNKRYGCLILFFFLPPWAYLNWQPDWWKWYFDCKNANLQVYFRWFHRSHLLSRDLFTFAIDSTVGWRAIEQPSNQTMRINHWRWAQCFISRLIDICISFFICNLTRIPNCPFAHWMCCTLSFSSRSHHTIHVVVQSIWVLLLLFEFLPFPFLSFSVLFTLFVSIHISRMWQCATLTHTHAQIKGGCSMNELKKRKKTNSS